MEEIDNGTIMNIRELEHDLEGCKEIISADLIKQILKDSTPNGGNYVVYEDFVKLMLNKSWICKDNINYYHIYVIFIFYLKKYFWFIFFFIYLHLKY